MRVRIVEARRTDLSSPPPLAPAGSFELRFGRRPSKSAGHRFYGIRSGSSLSGVIVAGGRVFYGTGDVTADERGELWRFSSTSQGGSPRSYLNLIFRPTGKRGAFIALEGKRRAGGAMDGVFFQDNGKEPAKDPCGKQLFEAYVSSSDENGKHTIYYHWWHYENCDKIQFIDTTGAVDDKGVLDPDKAKPIGPIRPLDRDPKDPKKTPPITIISASTPVNGEAVGPSEKRAGQMRLFYLDGCANVRVVQFVRNSTTYSPPKDKPGAKVPAAKNGAWKQDGSDPYGGQMDAPGGGTAVTDVPGQDPDGLALDADVKSCADGSTVTERWDFETFFYCDGKLIGWASWTMTVTFTISGGKASPGAPDRGKTTLHDPTDKSQSGGPK